jgi:predicted RNase H-like nuclease
MRSSNILSIMSKQPVAVLGIDAAWTDSKPSGVALIRQSGSDWKVIAAEPSYQTFIRKAGLSEPFTNLPDPQRLLIAARQLLQGESLAVVAVDIPLAKTPITGRRLSDNAVSLRYGKQHCGTHTPNTTRPGSIGTTMTEGWRGLGYGLITSGATNSANALIEVYPHPALLTLLNVDSRVPYKVAKSSKYWRGATVRSRIENLLKEMGRIRDGLSREISGIELPLPIAADVPTLASLKPYEDMLDALVCCWVGAKFLAGLAEPFGDQESAIWCPIDSCRAQPVS